MNKQLKDKLPLFENKDYEVVFVTGKNYYDEYKKVKVSNNVKIVAYLDNMIDVLNNTDLIVSRAGASSIAEITALGLPSILIPSPYVTHNHQYKNAKVLEENGACIIIEEDLFDSNILVNSIDEILSNNEKLKSLSDNTSKLGVRDSATQIYKVLRKMIDGDNNG